MDKLNVNPNSFRTTFTSISFPLIVGYMSVDESRTYHSDLSQLKFLNKIPKGKIFFDLKHRINDAVKRTTDDLDEKIMHLLRFLLDTKFHLSVTSNLSDNLLDASFVCYRRTMITLMCTPYVSDSWRIIATIFKGCIYLCGLETMAEKKRRQTRSIREKNLCAIGYKFEQFMLSDSPHSAPEINVPVIENEEFSLFYTSSIGDHKLLYGAQIDGLLVSPDTENKPLNTNDPDLVLSYLKNESFVELKTNHKIDNVHQLNSFKRYKLQRCWCQCYLARLKGLVVGYRDDNCILHHVEWFSTEDIASFCQDIWTPTVMLTFLEHFLTYVKKCLEHHLSEKYGLNAVYHINNLPMTSLHFEFNKNFVCVTNNFNPESDAILPEWFVKSYTE